MGGSSLVWARVAALPTRALLLPLGIASPVPTPLSVPVTWTSSHPVCPSLTSGPSSLMAASPLPPSLWDKVVAGMTLTLMSSSCSLVLTHVTLLATHRRHAQRAASAVVASLEFLSLHRSSTPQGRARLMDGSVLRGPFSFWRRVPVAFSPSPGQPPIMAFGHADDFASQLALDLMLLPPVPVPSGSPPATAASTVCHRCAPSVADPSIAALGVRHFTHCPHGLIFQRTCHNPVVEALAAIFTAALGSAAILVDRWGGDRAMVAFMQGPGAALTHTPDIVALGLEAPGVYTCIEVKTFDPSGPTHLATHHTATTRLVGHVRRLC